MDQNNINNLNSNPYDFILNNSKSKNPIFNFSNKRQLFILLSVGLIFFIIIFAVINSIFAGKPAIDINSYTRTIQIEQEIVHLTSEPGTSTLTGVNLGYDLTNSNSTINLVINSQEQQLLAYLKQNGYSLSQSTVNLGLNTSVDNALVAAYGNGNFNTVFQQELLSQLNYYQQSLNTTFKLSTGINGKKLLSQFYAQNTQLIKIL